MRWVYFFDFLGSHGMVKKSLFGYARSHTTGSHNQTNHLFLWKT